jgi:hypothetical protein
LRIFSEADKSGQVNEILEIGQRVKNSHIVDTPASIAEDIVRAVKRSVNQTKKDKFVCIQQTTPIKNANNTKGTVYCPLPLKEGEVTIS